MNKVLIIDDDKELCVLIKQSVLSENIEADFCNNGREGLQKLKEAEYQLEQQEYAGPENSEYVSSRTDNRYKQKGDIRQSMGKGRSAASDL